MNAAVTELPRQVVAPRPPARVASGRSRRQVRDQGPPPCTRAAEGWIRAFVALYLEVEAGLRPARHLRPLMVPDLQLRMSVAARAGRTPDVRSVHVQSRPGICEAVVLLQEGDRIAALAVAVRRDEQGWRIAEVRRPDGPLHPDPPQPDQVLEIRTCHEVTPTSPGPGWVLPHGWQRDDVASQAA